MHPGNNNITIFRVNNINSLTVAATQHIKDTENCIVFTREDDYNKTPIPEYKIYRNTDIVSSGLNTSQLHKINNILRDKYTKCIVCDQYLINVPDNNTSFDPELYLQLNPDIIAGGFDTPEKAQRHWLLYGYRENRPYTRQVTNQHYIIDDIYQECMNNTKNISDGLELLLLKTRNIQHNYGKKILHINIVSYDDFKYTYLSHLYILSYYLGINHIVVTTLDDLVTSNESITYITNDKDYTENCKIVKDKFDGNIIYSLDTNQYKQKSYMLYNGYHTDDKDYNYLHYSIMNPDFQPTKNNNVCSYRDLMNHWYNSGKREGRSAVLDTDKTLPPEELDQLVIDHILTSDQVSWVNDICTKVGKMQRAPTSIPRLLNFNILKQVLSTSCDVTTIFNIYNNQDIEHITKRDIPENFSVTAYKNLNRDLPREWTAHQLIKHYIEHSANEKQRLYRYVNNNHTNGTYVLINHDAGMSGAPIYIYNLAITLQEMGINVVLLDVYPRQSNPLKDRLNNPVRYYYSSASLLKKCIDEIEPLCIYANSFSLVVHDYENFEPYIDSMVIHLHETASLYKDHFGKSSESINYLNNFFKRVKNNKIFVVSKKIKQEYLDNWPWLNIDLAPPYLAKHTIDTIDKCVREARITTNNKQLTFGMIGDPSDRKGIDIFIQVAKNLPDIKFVWVGGKTLPSAYSGDTPKNFVHIKNVPNPYRYYLQFDYTFVTSRSDPCPYTILESFYIETPVIYLHGNITYEHNLNYSKDNLYIPIRNHNNNPDIITNQIKQLVKDNVIQPKQSQSGTERLKKYIIENFTAPKQFNYT